MLICCGCLNFIAAASSPQQQQSEAEDNIATTNALHQAFLQKYPRNFVFYSQCMDFFKQAIGPVTDLTINALNQRDLIYSLTLEICEAGQTVSWQLSICSNCNVAICAKRLESHSLNAVQATPHFLINSGILTNNEELSQKRSDKSFSETFGILIMDHPKLEGTISKQNQTSDLTIGSLSTSLATNSTMSTKQLRLRQLQANLQQRLQREIAETDERIQRYTEQQFALLKSFREKSEQEYQLLVSLIQCVPDQQANEWLDRQPPALDVVSNSGGSNLIYGNSRRRNTISSRRELSSNTAPTTPTTNQPPFNIFHVNKDKSMKNTTSATAPTSPTSAIDNNTRSSASIINTSVAATTLPPASSTMSTITVATVVGSNSNSSILSRKLSNFETPPATPEATPMSVGNSPTFRPQQQQNVTFVGQQTFQQQFLPTPTVETADDCLFELEGVDSNNVSFASSSSSLFIQNPPSPNRQQPNQNVPHQMLSGFSSYQRNLSYINQPPENRMSDLDESDGAEEAEDALDLDSSMPIPMTATPQRRINTNASAHMANYARSLPIEIANSPLTSGRKYIATIDSEDEDEIDNNVDIAASIKALAKSVHGEAVFGDLPRPRLRSQI